MPRFRIMVRRETAYDVTADTFEQAKEAALYEEYSKINDSDVDYEQVIDDESFQIDEDEG